MLSYVFSQIFVIFAMTALGMSYFMKKRKMILLLLIISTTCFAVEYLLLGAMSGVFINCVGIVRIIWFYFDNKTEKKNYVSLIVISVLIVAMGIISYKYWQDAMLVGQNLVFTFAIWQKSVKVYRWFAPFCEIPFIIYNITYRSLFGVIAEVIVTIVSVIALIMLYVGKKDYKKEIDVKIEEQEGE